MSVIIHGLDMPKSCDECRLFNECWCMALSVENWRKSYNKPPEGGRLPDCPLVPLPEGHGRLIDADAAAKEAYCSLLECEKYGNEFQKPYEIIRAIETAKTIVQAEGGQDNGN